MKKKAKTIKKSGAKKLIKKTTVSSQVVNSVGVTPLGDRVVIRPLTLEEMEAKPPLLASLSLTPLKKNLRQGS